MSSEAEVSAASPPRRAHRSREQREAELRKLIGATVAERYRVTALLGTGGMGAVYEAEHLGLGRKVAIKFIDREHAESGNVLSRFEREARTASSVESEHIVSVFDTGADDGRPFLVMELLRGEDLGARLRRVGKLSVSETMHIASQILRGLADAHEASVLHRDLKPDNVFLVARKSDDCFVKIVDFGVSKVLDTGAPDFAKTTVEQFALTRAGTILGTPLYMSPEQAQAFTDLDARTDLYGLGAILFECLTGRPPHIGETYEQILLSICLNEAPDPCSLEPSIPPEVARIVSKALSKDRERRYASARQMLVAMSSVPSFEAVATGVPTVHAMAPASAPTLPSSPIDGNKTLLAGGAAEPIAVRATVASASSEAREGSASSVPSGRRPGGARLTAVIATGLVASVLGAGITVWALTQWGSRGTPAAASSSAPRAARPSHPPAAPKKKAVPAVVSPTAPREAPATAGEAHGSDGAEPLDALVPVVPADETTPSVGAVAKGVDDAAASKRRAGSPALSGTTTTHAPSKKGADLDLERSFPD